MSEPDARQSTADHTPTPPPASPSPSQNQQVAAVACPQSPGTGTAPATATPATPVPDPDAPHPSTGLTVGVDQKVPLGQAILLGLQHVLAMDVYVPPFIIATSLALTGDVSTGLIQSTFLGAGIASLIQVLFFLRLPVCQGPSFVPVGAIIGLYAGTQGFDAVFGACLVGAACVILLGLSGLYKRAVHRFVPPVVSGTVIMIVGLTLLPSAFSSNIFVESEALSMGQNVLLACVSACVMILFSMLGVYQPKIGRVFRICSVIIALAAGCLVAWAMGGLDLSSVATTPLFSLPHVAFVNYGFAFDPSAILTMLVIFLVLLAETTGTWYAVSSVIGKPLSDEQINRGVIGEGIGCFIGAFLGTTPVTGYSTNAGIISITGVASRRVFVCAAGWFIALSFIGKLSALIMAIPSAVIGGVFAVVCSIIMLNGFRQMKSEPLTERQLYIIGVPIAVAVGLLFIPDALVAGAPTLLQYLLDSPIAVSALVAIVLNKALPARTVVERRKDEAAQADKKAA